MGLRWNVSYEKTEDTTFFFLPLASLLLCARPLFVGDEKYGRVDSRL